MVGDVSVNKIIFVAIACALLVTACSALTSADILIEPGKSQLTANGVDSTTITITVSNYTSPLSGQIVLDNPAMGKVAPSSFSLSPAYATFTANKTRGTAKIFVNVTDGVSDSASSETTIDLVHGEAYRIADLQYEQEIVVNSTTRLRAQVVDKYNNPVANAALTFSVSSPGGNARFVGSGQFNQSITAADGYAAVDLHVDTVAGDNIVLIDAPAGVDDRWIDIITHGSDPVSIEPTYDPDPSILPADGFRTLEATYVLRDPWSNPSPNWTIRIETDLGETAHLRTDSMGRAMMEYGPKRSTGILDITATVVDNTSITCTQRVEFISSDPASLLLTASPDNMQSLDLNDATTSEIRARLVDRAGHPIRGETVTFNIDTIQTGNFTQIDSPMFYNGQATVTAETEEDGYAIVNFTPGRFAEESQNAVASCTVNAAWGNLSESTILTWRNYLYLRVETGASRTVVNSTDPYFDVIVRLIGDGPELKEKLPIDVVLVFDRSGSMGYDSPTRISQAKTAAKTFVGQMDSSQDRIGLVSFASTTTLNKPLTDQFWTVNSTINSLDAEGATQLRRATYEAINELKQHGRSNAVKAVILMTDGEFNYDGSPIAHGTGWPVGSSGYTFSGNTMEADNYRYYDGLGGTLWRPNRWSPYRCTDGEFTNQNMSRYAEDKDIRLYTVSFAEDLDPVAVQALRIMANHTGGFYEHAPDGDKLAETYKKIAVDLDQAAKINPSMHLNLASDITNPEASWSSTQGLLEYIFIDDYSTYWRHYNWTYDPYNPSVILRSGTLNQSNEWRNSQTLTFDESVIGTMRRKETWEARFRLKVNGSVNETLGFSLFGPNSNIVVNGTETEIITPPNADITWIPNMSGSDLPGGNIDITLHTTAPPPGEYLNLTWDLEYSGAENNTIRKLYYRVNNTSSWELVALWTVNVADRKIGLGPWTWTETYSLDLRKLPSPSICYPPTMAENWVIDIRVVAEAPGAGRDEDIKLFDVPCMPKDYIKIE